MSNPHATQDKTLQITDLCRKIDRKDPAFQAIGMQKQDESQKEIEYYCCLSEGDSSGGCS